MLQFMASNFNMPLLLVSQDVSYSYQFKLPYSEDWGCLKESDLHITSGTDPLTRSLQDRSQSP